jgi:hypothetical protein
MPINKYNVVHTGPNRYPGGFHVGLLRLSNHTLLLALASNPLVIPTISQRRMAMMNFHVADNLFLDSILSINF